MANYYEMVQVKPTATDKEIETAIDARYNQWRALVTHHDDKVRDQANQAMRMLEQIRATLSDPAKRAVYDEAIGVRGATAGLVDPNAVLNVPRVVMPPPPPPRPPAPKPATQETSASKLWACQKCGEKNPEHTQFCYNCGAQLVRECPKCHKNTSLVATGFCGNCGASYEQSKRQIELRTQLTSEWNDLTKQRNGLIGEYETLNNQANMRANENYSAIAQTRNGTILITLGCGFLISDFLFGRNFGFYTSPIVFYGAWILLGIALIVFGKRATVPTAIGWGLIAFAAASFLVSLFGLYFWDGLGMTLLCAGAPILLGIVFLYLANQAKGSAHSKRDSDANLLREQAAQVKNQANALETPIMKLREQIDKLAD